MERRMSLKGILVSIGEEEGGSRGVKRGRKEDEIYGSTMQSISDVSLVLALEQKTTEIGCELWIQHDLCLRLNNFVRRKQSVFD